MSHYTQGGLPAEAFAEEIGLENEEEDSDNPEGDDTDLDKAPGNPYMPTVQNENQDKSAGRSEDGERYRRTGVNC